MIALVVLTVLSLAVAAVMSVVAWRLAREERRRRDARVEALAADIHPLAPPLAQAGDLFAATTSQRTRTSLAGALAIGILGVVGVAALAVVLTGGPQTGRTAAAAAVAPAAVAPLELVALGHERDRDRLTVRGVLRNPTGARPVEGLAAVVFVFNRKGGFVTSARAPMEHSTLAPGVESSFVVTVAGADDVGRYRVSFRSGDRIVTHVDRRGRAATVRLP